MRPRTVRMHAAADEVLRMLAEVERDLRTHGGVERQRRRRDVLDVALAAGCSPDALAEVLGVSVADIHAWGPGNGDLRYSDALA